MNYLRNSRANVASLLVITIAALAANPALADTLTVGPNSSAYDYTDIQSAIDAASDTGFTTIKVAEGTYTSTSSNVVSYDGKWIYIMATGDRQKTIIDGEGSRRCVYCADAPEAILKGFTIRNGKSGYGDGVTIENSSIHVVDCIISDHHAYALQGGGAWVFESQVVFKGCTFRNNFVEDSGSALFITSSDVLLHSCSVRDHHHAWAAAIEISRPDRDREITESYLRIKDSLFCQNTPEHIEVSSGNQLTNLGGNEFKDVCPEFESLLGFDFELELIFYVNIPPCDPLGELALGAMPIDNLDEFLDPSQIALTPQGNLAIVDSELGIVHGYNLAENTYEGALFQSDMMQQPLAVAFDEGFGYVADGAGMIHMFNATDGSQASFIQNEMLDPVDLAIDGNGFVWISSNNAAAPLQGWHPHTGGMMYPFSGELPGLEMPGAITVLPDGDLLVADRADSEIYRADPQSGEVTIFLGAEDARALELGEITSLKSLSDTRIYMLSDRGLSRFTAGGWFMGDIQDPAGMLSGITDFISIESDLGHWDPADFNFDGSVDGADLARLLGAWGSNAPELDLVRNGTIDGADLASLLGSWN